MRSLAILAVVLTMPDVRELVLYTSVLIQPDPKWETYSQFRLR